ncbi:MAG: hypothetical protein L6Q98_24965 [Anaerolineae bacterium]|nr:hypothetical protein [Anaerolineae bacterium]
MKPPERLFLTLLLLCAAGLRLSGIAHGQPAAEFAPTAAARQMIHENAAVHPDEFLYVSLPLRMLVSGQLNSKFFENPSLLINLNFVTDWLTGADAGRSLDAWAGAGDRQIASFDLYVVGRGYSALGGLIAVAAVYATTRRLAGRRAAAAAGLLTAAALPLVQHAHYTTTSSLAAGFGALALWGCVESLYRLRRGALKRNPFTRLIPAWAFAIAGVAAGLAAGSRYNAAGIALVNGVIGLLLLRGEGGRQRIAWVLIGWLAIPAAFILTTPHVLFDPQEVWTDFLYITAQYGGGAAVNTTPYGLVYELRYLVLYGVGIPAAVLAVAGALDALTRRRDPLLRAAALTSILMLAAYSLVVLRTQRPAHADQLLVPILPFVAVFAGMGVDQAARRWRSPARRAALIAVVVAVPLLPTLQVVSRFSQRDTRYLMQAWIEENIPHGARVHLNGQYNVPLDPAHYLVSQNFGGEYPPLDDLLAEGLDYVVISDAWAFDWGRTREYIAPETLMQLSAYLADWQTRLRPLARLDRPTWIGQGEPLHTASIWGHPGLTVYCVSGRSC